MIYLLDNKLGSQVYKGKYQRIDDSICIIVIDTCFTLIKSLHNIKIQMWFYHHTTILFIPLFGTNKFRRIVDRKDCYKL